jgi:uncharacterized protein with PIN domain
MNFNEQQLSEIEKFGALLFSPNEIAIILEIDEDEFSEEIQNKKTKASKGFLMTKAGVRESIIEMAKRDSSPAQTLVDRVITNIEMKLHD